MPEKTLRNLLVPKPGDPILATLTESFSKAGVNVPVASVAAARVLLDQMETAGYAPTVSDPLTLLIGSGARRNIYISDGSKNGTVWYLQKSDEVEIVEGSYASGVHATLSQFQFSGMILSALPTRPYDRAVVASGYAYGQVTAGRVNLGLRIGSAADQAESRFDPTEASAASVTNSGIIRAGVTPEVRLGVVGDHPSIKSRIELGKADKLSKLVVVAYPISMA